MNSKDFIKLTLFSFLISIIGTLLTVFVLYHFSLIQYFMPGGFLSQFQPTQQNVLNPTSLLPSVKGLSPSSAIPMSQPAMQPINPTLGKTTEVKDVCASNLEKFCSEATDLVQKDICLDHHYEQLSANCKTRFSNLRQQMNGCAPDIKKFCNSESYAGGLMMNCLQNNKKKVSASCKVILGGTE